MTATDEDAERKALADEWDRYIQPANDKRDYITPDLIDRTIAALRAHSPSQPHSGELPANTFYAEFKGEPLNIQISWYEKLSGIGSFVGKPADTSPHSGEPVAWQKRNSGNDWSHIYDCSDENLRALDQAGWETRPLYASPPATQIGGAVVGDGYIVPLADHDEIGRIVSSQPWEIQKAIVTIAAHSLVLTDECPTGKVADLAGCISQTCLELANLLAVPKPQRSVARAFYGAECPSYPNCSGGCGLGCTHEIETAKAAKVVERCAQEAETWQGLKGRKLADKIRALSPTELHEGGE